ncbi:hypothetical protein JOM56_009952 [Amanita muscaria]
MITNEPGAHITEDSLDHEGACYIVQSPQKGHAFRSHEDLITQALCSTPNVNHLEGLAYWTSRWNYISVSKGRSLRLVCKMFDDIWASEVMVELMLFPSELAQEPHHSLVKCLQSLVHRKSNTTTYKTITIKNWHILDTRMDRFASALRLFWNQRPIIMMIITALIVVFLIVPVVFNQIWIYFFIYTMIFICLILVAFYTVLLVLLIHPKKIPHNTRTVLNVYRARYYSALLPQRVDFPNVRLFFGYCQCDWVIYRSARILWSLQQLTELELAISDNTDMDYLAKRTLIARNANSTHFNYDWRPTGVLRSLSDLFSNVPTDKPLKLHHVSLNDCCTNFEALVPHVLPLTSFTYHSSQGNTWCAAFLRAKVFPPMIKVESLDLRLVLYLRRYSGIISLSIAAATVPQGSSLQGSSLWRALMQHEGTLRQLCLNTKLLTFLLENVENEMNFLQCTSNLHELILMNDEKLSQYQDPSDSIRNERQLFHIIARLSHLLTVVIRAQEKGIFLLCLEFCRTSENPLIRSLVRRLVYEREAVERTYLIFSNRNVTGASTCKLRESSSGAAVMYTLPRIMHTETSEN